MDSLIHSLLCLWCVQVLGNGLSVYPNPDEPDFGLSTLPYIGGIMNEHFAVFEQVNSTSDSLIKDLVVEDMVAIDKAIATPNKTVMLRFWPGLFNGLRKFPERLLYMSLLTYSLPFILSFSVSTSLIQDKEPHGRHGRMARLQLPWKGGGKL